MESDMAKVDWSNLKIIEEWTPIRPGDTEALQEQRSRIKLMADIIFNAYRKEKLEKLKKLRPQRGQIEKERVA
jgi:hypothetical protein